MKSSKLSIISVVAVSAVRVSFQTGKQRPVSGAPVATTSPEGRRHPAVLVSRRSARRRPRRRHPRRVTKPVRQSPSNLPEPKKYVLAAGTPISVRTVGEVNTKAAKNGNEFEATLESPLVAEGHTVAKEERRLSDGS